MNELLLEALVKKEQTLDVMLNALGVWETVISTGSLSDAVYYKKTVLDPLEGIVKQLDELILEIRSNM